MKLSHNTVAAILERWTDEDIVHDHCADYGEPGYDHTFDSDIAEADRTLLVVLGSYWCRCDKVIAPEGHYMAGKPMLHPHEDHHPRLWQQLVDQGVSFEWYDEWTIDYDNGKAYRTSGDSYSWMQSFRWTDDGEMLTADDDIEEWIDYAKNDSQKVLPSNIITDTMLREAGFVKHNGQFESGWHPGQDDDPKRITDEMHRDLDDTINRDNDDLEIVFLLDYAQQFDIGFSAYYRWVGADVEVDA
jgi:hypothetical protein